MYVQGVYVFHAFNTVMSNFHLDGKQHRINTYLEKPLDYFLTIGAMEKRKRKKEELERQKLVAYLTEFQKSWENKKKKGAENGS